MPNPGLPELQRALHPLDAPPRGPGWNLPELDGLLPAAAIHIEAAVLVGLLPRASGLQVLLTRRTEMLRHHAGQVSFPGGRVDAGDGGPLAAALREADEEIGLSPAQVQPLGWLDPLATITGYRVLPVVARISPAFEPRPDPGEVAEVFEVPLSFLLAPANLARIDIEFAGRNRQVLEFRQHGDPDDDTGSARRIWGATASILANFRERLEALR
jgi:8-oxo-dGTP pyrophosphatase MutT (NUDIX family)